MIKPQTSTPSDCSGAAQYRLTTLLLLQSTGNLRHRTPTFPDADGKCCVVTEEIPGSP
jgi:hypothetical protein